MADLFDLQPVDVLRASVPMFNITKYAEDLYRSSNPNVQEVKINIKERSLSNNQDYDKVKSDRYVWRTNVGAERVRYPDDEEPNSMVAL